jgi:hypothetical protein
MPSRRTPLKRAYRSLISDAALDAFAALKLFDEGTENPQSHEQWWLLHSRLSDEIPDKKLWEWPCVCAPARASDRDEVAVKRWHRLDAALAERVAATTKR